MTQAAPSATSKSFSCVLRQILPDLILLPSIALVLSAIMTWANVGFGDEFLGRWMRGFITSLVVLPMILACLGVLEKFVDSVMGPAHWVARKLVVALLTACLIESVLAVAVTLINPSAGITFAQSWWLAFSRSLPMGVLIGVFMCFYMKPRMDRMRAAAKAAQA
jgi:hypothetical protein